MYTPYLMFAYAVALALALVGCAVVRRSVPGLRGLEQLRRYVLCDLSAVILLGLRLHAPLFFTEIVPNLIVFVGVVFLYSAVAAILEIRPRLLFLAVALCAAAAPVMVWFAYVQQSVISRLETHCAVLIVLLAISTAALFRESGPALRDPARACAWLLTATVMVNAGWGIYGLLNHSDPDFLHPAAVHAAFSYLAMMLTLGNVIGLSWLSFCAHREELKKAAQTDALTGLLNRGAFQELLERELGRGERDLWQISIILLDIDYFKQVNDEHGHLVGDDVLRRVGLALRAGIRPSDVLARFGGEEFVVLLRDAALEAAEEIAERLRIEIAALNDLPREVNLTGSFGVATSAPREKASQLLSRADRALYRSKREGRNLVHVDCGTEVSDYRKQMPGADAALVIEGHCL